VSPHWIFKVYRVVLLATSSGAVVQGKLKVELIISVCWPVA